MDPDRVRKIKEIYADFRTKLEDILSRRKLLLKTYRTKIEEAKIKELRDSLNNSSK